MVTSDEIRDLLGVVQRVNDDVALSQQGVDSLEVATLLIEVERKYDVLIPTDVVGRLSSLRDIVDFLNDAAKKVG